MPNYAAGGALPAHSRNMHRYAWPLIVVIALADWQIQPNISLGFLYTFPVLLAASRYPLPVLTAVATACALLREFLGPFANDGDRISRFIIVWTAYVGSAAFLHTIVRSRETAERVRAEMSTMLESSPAAMLTCDEYGKILLANDAAHRLFGAAAATLSGQDATRFLPMLKAVHEYGAAPPPRTMAECRGHRADGAEFPARLWFSVYPSAEGPRLSAMIMDLTEEIRNQQEEGLEAMMSTSRILVRAVHHEVRNAAWALRAAFTRIRIRPGRESSADFHTVEHLLSGLESLAASSNHQPLQAPVRTRTTQVLDDLRIVAETTASEKGISVSWDVPAVLPEIRVPAYQLMQVMLNLINNSLRAMEHTPQKHLTVSASAESEDVIILVRDTGGGIENPAQVFRPFAEGAKSTGLGLYVSEAVVRSFGGEITYCQIRGGSLFTVRAPRWESQLAAHRHH
jgi:two-component system, LuxR family, sensor kinase FixL